MWSHSQECGGVLYCILHIGKEKLHVMAKKKSNVKRNICNETVVYYEIYSDLPSGMFGFEDVKATRYATPSSCKYLKCPGWDG